MGIFDFFKSKKKVEFSKNELIDAGACPNCWGHQEYEGKFYQYMKDKEIDLKNHSTSEQKAFIGDFVEKKISGIKLINKGDHFYCKTCGSKVSKS